MLVDELVESGRTFGALAEKLRQRGRGLGAGSVRTLCLVDKPDCRMGAEATRLPFFASAFLSSALASAMFCPSSSLHLPPSLSLCQAHSPQKTLAVRTEGGLTVDYRALTAGKDDWLFGYGMDTKERVRSLPFIAVANQRCRDADWATPEPTHNYLA